jgi:predicted metalloprotease with PDZ domain
MTTRSKLSLALLIALLILLIVSDGFAAEVLPAPIHYSITLEHPAEHLLRIVITVPPGAGQREFQLPVWNATYQVRDFSEYVRWVHAQTTSGTTLEPRKLTKSLWRVSGMERGGSLEYEVMADQPGPFGAQFNAEHAFLNLAQILMYPADTRADIRTDAHNDARNAPMTVSFAGIPEGWHLACALKGDPSELRAADYDTLVDSPVELGKFQETTFSEDGGHYRVVVDAVPDAYDLPRLKETLRKIVHAETEWMQDRPFQDYLFIYHFPPNRGDGGMEHANSTAIELSSRSLKADPDQFASMTAHEFFHLWNVKRIRPQSLAPVDYTKENYTRALWFSEGVTSTVEQYALLQSGLIDEKSFLRDLSDEITTLQNIPARLTQSAEESSLDAWLEKYPSYRQPNRSISYYNKGLLLGVLLDLAMRKESNNEASLRDVFHYLNQTYAQKGKFFDDSDGVRQAAEALSGADLGWFFRKYVAGTDEIPYDNFLAWVGLRVLVHEKIVPEAGFRAARNFDASPVVVYITPGSEAAQVGLAVGDTVVSLNDVSVARDLELRIAALPIGAEMRLHVLNNNGGERDLTWKLGEKKTQEYAVTDVEHITPEQLRHRKLWLDSHQAKTPEHAAGTQF